MCVASTARARVLPALRAAAADPFVDVADGAHRGDADDGPAARGGAAAGGGAAGGALGGGARALLARTASAAAFEVRARAAAAAGPPGPPTAADGAAAARRREMGVPLVGVLGPAEMSTQPGWFETAIDVRPPTRRS